MSWNHITREFFIAQYEEVMAFADQCDRLDVLPLGPEDFPPNRYIVRFQAPTLIRAVDGQIGRVPEFTVGIHLPADYLRHVEPIQLVCWMLPVEVWHPNIRVPFVCLGRIAPCTPLVEIIYQLYEIGTYQNYATGDALNSDAAQWARNYGQFPLDASPLKRHGMDLTIEPIPGRP
jgi:hypothetical protein